MIQLTLMQLRDITDGYTKYLLRCIYGSNEIINKNVIVDGICGEHMLHIPETVKERSVMNRNWVEKIRADKEENSCMAMVIDLDEEAENDKMIENMRDVIVSNLNLADTDFQILAIVYHGMREPEDAEIKMHIRVPHFQVVLKNKYAARTKKFELDRKILTERYR